MKRVCEAFRDVPQARNTHGGRLCVVWFTSGEMIYVCEEHLDVTVQVYPWIKVSPFLGFSRVDSGGRRW
jgi:hypothetical protein